MSDARLEDNDYIIGTDDVEVRRLGQQHAIWRETALAGWRRAGIRPGMTVMDVGAGPGYAAFDLARLVGPQGRVIAVDQSARFLEALREGARVRGLDNIETIESDLADLDWPHAACDAIWSRWCLSFVPNVPGVMAGIDKALKAGGRFVAQEYVDYRSFRIEPGEPVFDRFIEAVRRSWVHFGGDPEIGRRLPALMSNLGWEPGPMTPVIHAARPGDWIWTWPMEWLKQSPDRLVELGFLDPGDADSFRVFLHAREQDPASLLMTPMVLEVVARKPGA
ncbi:methyltransferase domain-containing protein [Maricaulis sp.]|uniref:methyltransferase domain-containing protein n=1 Tax=Maricaulis sp. TaxID=1486257 RepID=UPI002622BC21|nr:methyltransferase domain-containing protein [Maricaulis sp.]